MIAILFRGFEGVCLAWQRDRRDRRRHDASWLMSRLGRDPAFGSGPLVKIVQDVLSLVIYFTTAMLIMQ